MDLIGPEGVDADGEIRPGATSTEFSQQSYGAHFAEVGVDIDTGEVRLRRMLGVFTAGRVLNEKTARSQAIGGMIFGIGAALEEAMILDPRFGCFVNHDLAEYHVPVHADVLNVDAIFLPELDAESNPLKSKGDRRTGHLRGRRIDRQRDLQRLRRARPRLSDNPGQVDFRTTDAGMKVLPKGGPDVGRGPPRTSPRAAASMEHP